MRGWGRPRCPGWKGGRPQVGPGSRGADKRGCEELGHLLAQPPRQSTALHSVSCVCVRVSSRSRPLSAGRAVPGFPHQAQSEKGQHGGGHTWHDAPRSWHIKFLVAPSVGGIPLVCTKDPDRAGRQDPKSAAVPIHPRVGSRPARETTRLRPSPARRSDWDLPSTTAAGPLPVLSQPPPGATSVLTKITLSLSPAGTRIPESTGRPGGGWREGLAGGLPPAGRGYGCRRSRYCGRGFSLTYFWMYQHVRWAFRSSSTTKSRAALARCLAMPRPR